MEKNPFGDIYEYKYDSFGNLIWAKNPSGDIFEWKYDSFGNKIWRKYPFGDISEYKYKYIYNEEGILVEMKLGEKIIWKLNL